MMAVLPSWQPTEKANSTERNRLMSFKEQNSLWNLIIARKLEGIFLEIILCTTHNILEEIFPSPSKNSLGTLTSQYGKKLASR